MYSNSSSNQLMECVAFNLLLLVTLFSDPGHHLLFLIIREILSLYKVKVYIKCIILS